MARHRVTPGDRTPAKEPLQRLSMLRSAGQRRAGWVPESTSVLVAESTGTDVDALDWNADWDDDWDSARWSDDDLLMLGIPDVPTDGELDDADRDSGELHDAQVDLGDVEADRAAIGEPTAARIGHPAAKNTVVDAAEPAVDDPGPTGDPEPTVDPEPSAAGQSDAQPQRFSARRIRGRRWGRLSENWVPEPFRDARVDPGRRGALILTLVAALAAIAAAIGVWRDRPAPRPVQPVAMAPVTDTAAGSSARTPATTGSLVVRSRSGTAGSGFGTVGGQPTAAGSSAGPAVIAVSVTGLVHHPGLVRLPTRSRVADAIAAAGGITDQGDVTGLNLAAVLSDGDSVVVGARAATPASGSGPAGGTMTSRASTSGTATQSPINLNTADQTTLESLPGVGPVMAGNILAWRQQNGSFTSIDQLQEVTGIGPSRYAQLALLVTLG
ncbi:MAG: ComEA family DNA-binding protein [Actinomycetota bacterium]|nr:ComEA family DNA-binding protein [Actinomycetota bacterium]